MSDFYEKKQWIKDSKSYAGYAYLFNIMCWIFGLFGLIEALIDFFIGVSHFSDGGWAAILGSIATGFQSILIIVFGMMMKGLSLVALANFEMSVSETRTYVESELSSDDNA